jgi:predicted pyridoxine 5'-phosphate oxidase superfamily flavin-nucleotide-binding protein
MNRNFTQFAFTEAVRKLQEQYGSRSSYARMEASGDKYELTPRESSFIQSRDSFYMATVGENGWPYMQFRGGPKGFLHVIDATTLGYADFRGNKQYISTGNILTSGKATLFLMDYPSQSRLKIWVHPEVIAPDDDADLAQALDCPDYDATVERLVVLRIQAYDWNCPQHITPRYTVDEISEEMIKRNPNIIAPCCPDEES